MRPRIDPLDHATGVEILDPIENNRYALHTPETVSPTSADTDAFVYPVSVAWRVTTSGIRLPYNVPVVVVRDAADGSHITDVGHDRTFELDADEYLLEVDAPVKTYLRVASSLVVEATTEYVEIAFGGETTIELGARSNHSSPAGTVTVPDDPETVMQALSTFGSGLKTTTCERSWPTLRGHPPLLERGDELAIPDDIDTPDTGVTLRIPADYEHVCTVAPLAYYLGATVVPDERPRLTAETGFSHPLDTERGFEDEVVRVLKQAFLLDCVTRTEGFHPMDMAERRAVESVTDLDFADLYGAALGEQLAAYLSVPYSALTDAMPAWSRTTHVRPVADSVELLPFVARDLSLVRVQSRATDSSPSPGSAASTDGSHPDQHDALSAFKRGPQLDDGGLGLPTDADSRATGVPDSSEYVPLPETDSMERAWVGDGTPVHGAKLLDSAFAHDRTEPTDGIIDVTVVCNDEQMREEWDTVSEVYGMRDTVPFDVDCRFDVSTAELRSLLAEDHDLFHFIGHIDGRGFACSDGILDAETVEETGATTILLNACRSHDQGVALVEAGARTAIVSWGDVDNLGAVEVGETFARLLNYGFGVGAALEIVEEYTAIGRHYLVVGDPSVTIAQCADGNPLIYDFGHEYDATTVPAPDEEVSMTLVSYATEEYPIGAAAKPQFQSAEDPDFYLVPGRLKTFTNSGAKIERTLSDYSAPVVVGGELHWTDEWFAEGEPDE
ncbi:hypothetical protein [Halorussus sp. MSC15.2]|uniref:hypothetical protein n=1 Tax=Halorussus sp. MSC15.2 TaxID=2283638 RepID=UPI0013D12B00|nr:hypothetical protein [Halorussus sp. MSC15.2]NEU57134.1 hypothetical protein [Halorussus sp. MSC15.2]